MAGQIAAQYTNLTVAEALVIGENLYSNTSTEEYYCIEGYVNVITENSFNTSFNNMTFWLADTQGRASSNAAGALYVYRGRPDIELHEGDRVSIIAKIKKFGNSDLIETDPNNAPVTWISSGPVVPPKDTTYGSLRVCAQNLENYYYNYTESERPSYDDEEGFCEKTRNIVDAMLSINADIYAFCEVEAKPIVLEQLADTMNAHAGAAGRYAAVYDGIDYDFDGIDNHIKSGFIYRTDKVGTVGYNYSPVRYGYYTNTMRIQAFEQLSNGEKLVVSMNHFKAKDSSADAGEGTRINNANQLMQTLNGYIPEDDDILVLGDLNCQYGEAPIDIILAYNFEEQILRFDSTAFSHCFNGGELIDHVFANSSMRSQIVDAYVKHICAYKCNASVDRDKSYSDHDPYVVEINLGGGEQGITHTNADAGAIKELRHGQLIIIRSGVEYTVTGQRVR